MSFSVDVLANIAIELQRGIGHQDRFQRLITTLRQVLECDASALLRYDSRQFIPLAIDGLAKDVLGRRFALEGHPRLEAIARAGDVVRFPADSELPDPYVRSQRSASFIKWVEMKIVTLSWRERSTINCQNISLATGSTPEVGSSRINISGR